MANYRQKPTRWMVGAMLLGTVGCGDGMARVTGTVSIDGNPVVKTDTVRAEVTLKPVAGGSAATGSVDAGGRFRLAVGSSPSVSPGDYAASVRIREVTPPATPGGYPKSRNLMPDRYANSAKSGLVYTLEPGSNQIEIEIPAE